MSEIKNGHASISLGYIGIHETINALFGNTHMYDSDAARKTSPLFSACAMPLTRERRDRLRL